MYNRIAKRMIDVLVSAACLIFLSPIMLIVAIAIYLQDFASPLFRQKRVGYQEQEFTILKFRSMPVDTANVASKDAAQIQPTTLGRFIRRTNLDELPQLLNILLGDMSLIGAEAKLGITK